MLYTWNLYTVNHQYLNTKREIYWRKKMIKAYYVQFYSNILQNLDKYELPKYPWHKLPQFQERASKKWEQTDPGTKDWLYLIEMTLVRPAMTDLKKTVRADCAVSACSPPPSIYKSYCSLIISGGSRSLDKSLPSRVPSCSPWK